MTEPLGRERLARLAEAYAPMMAQGLAAQIRKLSFNRHPFIYFLAQLGLRRLIRARDVATETFWSRRLELPFGDWESRYLFYYGILGSSEYPLIKFFIRNMRPEDVFYDIGANYGFYSFLAEELITKGEIHAFEPSPRVFHYLRRNAEGGRGNLVLNEAALSDRSGEPIEFYDSFRAQHSGASTLLGTVAASGLATGYDKIRVKAMTLDEYARTHRGPTLMKIDVEGAEEAVIQGGVRTLSGGSRAYGNNPSASGGRRRRGSPAVVMEVWGGRMGEEFSSKAVRKLEGMGYRAHRIDFKGELQTADIPALLKGQGIENVVFMRP